MAISLVQQTSALDTSGGTGSVSKAFTSNNTAGNMIVAVLVGSDTTNSLFNTEFVDVTDSRNTYVKVFDQYEPTWQVGVKVFVAYNIGAGANTVTCSNDTNNPAALYIHEVAGLATSAAFDKIHFHKTVTGSGSFDSLSTAATTNANEFVLGLFANGSSTAQTWTLGSGYSNLLSNTNASGITSAVESKIISASAAQNATATSTVTTAAGVYAVLTFSDTSITSAPSIVHIGTTLNTTSGTHTLAAGVLSGDLIAIVRANTGNTTSHAPTDNNADGNGTYTLATSALKATSADLMEVWVRDHTIGTSSSTTFSDVAGTTTGGGISVFRLTGMTKVSSAAVLQVASQANHASGSAPAPVFSSSVTTTNMVLSSVFNAGASTGELAEKSGYQRSNYDKYSTPTTALQSMSINSGETGTTITWGTSSSSAFCSIAVEFDTSASSVVNASVTQVAATLTATGGTQAVATSNLVAISQVAATLTATGGTQAIATVNNVSITQVAANLTITGGTQAVATSNNVSITQVAATLTITGGTQVVTTNSSNAQVAANLTATGGTQAVATVNNVSISQVAANLTITGGTQSVVTTAFGSVTQVAATLTATGGTQTATTNSSNAQVAANMTVSGGTQSVATVNDVNIAQVAANLTVAGGTQATATVNDIAISQVAANLTTAGGTQSVATVNNVSIAQVAANLTTTGGTQAVISTSFASIAQVAANLTATGGTQAVSASTIASVSIAQVAANITATGGTQSVNSARVVAITQSAATLTATGGTQTIAAVNIVAITQVAATITATTGQVGVNGQLDIAISQVAANITATTGQQAVVGNVKVSGSVTQAGATITATTGTPAIGTTLGPPLKNPTEWLNNDIKLPAQWSNASKNDTVWANNINKNPTLYTIAAKLTNIWYNESVVQVSYLYDDPTKTYDSSSRGYDYLTPVTNQLNSKQPTVWSAH